MSRAFFVINAIVFVCVLNIEGHTQTQPFSRWDDSIHHNLARLDSWSFDLVGLSYDNDTHNPDTILMFHVDASADRTDLLSDYESVRFRKDSMWVVDHLNGSFSFGPTAADTIRGLSPLHLVFANHYLGDLGYSAYWFSFPRIFRSNNLSDRDTFVNGQLYKLLQENCQRSWMFNSETGEYDIPIYDTVYYFLDTATMWVEQVDVHNSHSRSHYRFAALNINENKNKDNHDIFAADNPQYIDYEEYHLPYQIPSSIVLITNEDSAESPTSLFNFPLVNVEGDTLRLKDTTGWKLINFWNYSCGACIRHFKQMQDEIKTQGYRDFEHEGISLYCVNYLSGNTQKFHDFVRRYGMEDIGYSARDLNCVNIQYTPYFLLFAPNGDLVFEGQYKNTRSLLRTKRSYERRHRRGF